MRLTSEKMASTACEGCIFGVVYSNSDDSQDTRGKELSGGRIFHNDNRYEVLHTSTYQCLDRLMGMRVT